MEGEREREGRREGKRDRRRKRREKRGRRGRERMEGKRERREKKECMSTSIPKGILISHHGKSLRKSLYLLLYPPTSPSHLTLPCPLMHSLTKVGPG